MEEQAWECKHETGDIKAFLQEQKHMQEHTTAELGLLRGELNNQVTEISDVEESISNKIGKIDKSVSSVEELSPQKRRLDCKYERAD